MGQAVSAVSCKAGKTGKTQKAFVLTFPYLTRFHVRRFLQFPCRESCRAHTAVLFDTAAIYRGPSFALPAYVLCTLMTPQSFIERVDVHLPAVQGTPCCLIQQ